MNVSEELAGLKNIEKVVKRLVSNRYALMIRLELALLTAKEMELTSDIQKIINILEFGFEKDKNELDCSELESAMFQ